MIYRLLIPYNLEEEHKHRRFYNNRRKCCIQLLKYNAKFFATLLWVLILYRIIVSLGKLAKGSDMNTRKNSHLRSEEIMEYFERRSNANRTIDEDFQNKILRKYWLN